jgi:hypothetical protein
LQQILKNGDNINNNINNIKSTTFRGNQLPAAARENDLPMERPGVFLSPIRSNDRQSRTIRAQVVGRGCIKSLFVLPTNATSCIHLGKNKNFSLIFCNFYSLLRRRIFVTK